MRSASDPDRFVRCINRMAADRAGFVAEFGRVLTPPVCHGLAMRPLRTCPVYRRRDGRLVLVSGKSLLEMVTSGMYWLLHDHLRRRTR